MHDADNTQVIERLRNTINIPGTHHYSAISGNAVMMSDWLVYDEPMVGFFVVFTSGLFWRRDSISSSFLT